MKSTRETGNEAVVACLTPISVWREFLKNSQIARLFTTKKDVLRPFTIKKDTMVKIDIFFFAIFFCSKKICF